MLGRACGHVGMEEGVRVVGPSPTDGCPLSLELDCQFQLHFVLVSEVGIFLLQLSLSLPGREGE